MARKKATLKIRQKKSGLGSPRRHRDTLRALGFRRHQQTVEQPDNPSIRGMIQQVSHLVEVVEPEGEE